MRNKRTICSTCGNKVITGVQGVNGNWECTGCKVIRTHPQYQGK